MRFTTGDPRSVPGKVIVGLGSLVIVGMLACGSSRQVDRMPASPLWTATPSPVVFPITGNPTPLCSEPGNDIPAGYSSCFWPAAVVTP